MDAKEVLSKAHAALVQSDYKRAIGYYEQLLQQVMASGGGGGVKGETMEQKSPLITHKRRRKLRGNMEFRDQMKRDLLLGYANAMAYCENPADLMVASAFHVYRQLLANRLDVDGQTMERLLWKATAALVESVVRSGRKKGGNALHEPFALAVNVERNHLLVGDSLVAASAKNDLEIGAPVVLEEAAGRQLVESCSVDPLLCGVCDDLLKFPVTAQCGHTFCRQCAVSLRKCNRCPIGQNRTNSAGAIAHDQNCSEGLEKDVLVSRLVDKWWGAELSAETRNENARLSLEAGQLDQALRSANESLEQGKCVAVNRSAFGVLHDDAM